VGFDRRSEIMDLLAPAGPVYQAGTQRRELKEISTENLFILLLRYADALRNESSDTAFSLVEDTAAEALLGDFKRMATWRA
jgi:glutamate-1-semialdehyde aminotransferase